MPEYVKSENTLPHEISSRTAVPGDFPVDLFPAALAGSQTKFSARAIDGKFVVGRTADERSQAYLQCVDLLNQLIEYTQRKLDQKPEVPRAEILNDIVKRIPLQGWALSNPELEWIAKQLRQILASR